MMNSQKYKLSFTAASLSISESVIVADVDLACKNWDETKATIKEKNLLQARASSSGIRVLHELMQRLRELSDLQLELLVDGTVEEQKQLLWFAVSKTYSYIQEFAIEVVREKFMSLNFELSSLDYEAFYSRKADWHSELDEITASTQAKLRQVIFRMLREANVISAEHFIMPTLLSPRVEAALEPDAPTSYQIFPLHKINLSER